MSTPRRNLLSEKHAHRYEIATLTTALSVVLIMAVLLILASRL